MLRSLGREITKHPDSSATVKFAQLYSYVMQRYIAGKDVLGPESKWQLISVMVEIEQTTLRTILARAHSEIKRAIEKKSLSLLENEHDFLLGTAARAGELLTKLDFDYGKDADGRPITAPKKLPAPPVTETTAGLIKQQTVESDS